MPTSELRRRLKGSSRLNHSALVFIGFIEGDAFASAETALFPARRSQTPLDLPRIIPYKRVHPLN